MADFDLIKKLRQETDVSISQCQKALKEAKNDLNLAREILKKWGNELAAKKSEREVKQGIVDSYIHPNKKIGVVLKLLCETDFVAKNPDFQNLAHEICLQIAAVNSEEVSLLEQPWIKDETKTIKDLINESIAKLGENIVVDEFKRLEI